METKKSLKKQKDNAERRATTYYRIVQAIENILFIEQSKKTPAVFIVDKIKEVIPSDQTKK